MSVLLALYRVERHPEREEHGQVVTTIISSKDDDEVDKDYYKGQMAAVGLSVIHQWQISAAIADIAFNKIKNNIDGSNKLQAHRY